MAESIKLQIKEDPGNAQINITWKIQVMQEGQEQDPNIRQTRHSQQGFQELSYQKRKESKYCESRSNSESNVPIPHQI